MAVGLERYRFHTVWDSIVRCTDCRGIRYSTVDWHLRLGVRGRADSTSVSAEKLGTDDYAERRAIESEPRRADSDYLNPVVLK
jgi:hypothetical protein